MNEQHNVASCWGPSQAHLWGGRWLWVICCVYAGYCSDRKLQQLLQQFAAGHPAHRSSTRQCSLGRTCSKLPLTPCACCQGFFSVDMDAVQSACLCLCHEACANASPQDGPDFNAHLSRTESWHAVAVGCELTASTTCWISPRRASASPADEGIRGQCVLSVDAVVAAKCMFAHCPVAGILPNSPGLGVLRPAASASCLTTPCSSPPCKQTEICAESASETHPLCAQGTLCRPIQHVV